MYNLRQAHVNSRDRVKIYIEFANKPIHQAFIALTSMISSYLMIVASTKERATVVKLIAISEFM